MTEDGDISAANPSFSPWTRSLIAGALAGLTVDFSLYPLDTIKTRLQSQFLHDGRSHRAMISRYTISGTLRSMYAGLPSALLGSMPSAACFFVLYDGVKRSLVFPSSQEIETSDATTTAAAIGTLMLASSLGETGACAIRVPTEVIKQRAQAGLYNGSSTAALLAILRLRHEKGSSYRRVVREMYRGSGITIAREIPFTILQFGMWEYFKSMYAARKLKRRSQGHEQLYRSNKGDKLDESERSKLPTTKTTAIESAIFGSLAGGIAAAITTPLDVLKTHIMVSTPQNFQTNKAPPSSKPQPTNTTSANTSAPLPSSPSSSSSSGPSTRFKPHLQTPSSSSSSLSSSSSPPSLKTIIFQIHAKEGWWHGFFRGLGPRVAWISVGGAIFLGTYQAVWNVVS